MLCDILNHGYIQWHSQLIIHFPKSWPCYRTRPYYRFWPYYQILGEVSIEYLKRVQQANRGRLLLQTPGPVPFGTSFVLILRTFSSECVIFPDFEFQREKKKSSDSVSLYFYFLHLWFPLKWRQESMTLWPWLTFMLKIAFHDFFLPWA